MWFSNLSPSAMNLEECIAALPRTERGNLRDIFSPILTRPEPYSLDLVAEYSRFSNQQTSASTELPYGTGAAKQTQRSSQQPPSTQSQRQPTAAGSVDGRYNCSVCKKSFGSEATWNSHEMSAKHIASVKAAEKKNKGGAKNQSGQKGSPHGAGTGGGGRQSRVQESVMEQDPPEVAEALLSFRKAERIASQNPDMAAPVLWKIAKETARALLLLIRVLEGLQAAVSTSGGGPGAGAPGSLSPTQISMTLYLSRLALARLVFYRSPSLASQYYLDAIQGRWQMDPNDFQSMCETVTTGSAAQLLEHCKRFLRTHPKTEKLLRPSPIPTAQTPSSSSFSLTSDPPAVKKASDPNLKLLTVLLESASMLSQSSTAYVTAGGGGGGGGVSTTKEDRYLAEISLVLYAMALALTLPSEEDSLETTRTQEVGLLRQMALVYHQGLGMSYAAAACLIQAGDSALSMAGVDSAVARERSLWDGLQALLLAMETGDFVRMQSAMRLLDRCGIASYHDVQIITELASAVISQDNDFLHNNAAHVLEHLRLIVQESAEVGAPSEILLCQYKTPSASMAVLHRIQQLVV
ncbi:hypothetical protein BGZ70_009017 [Mortierella alpina]|uniref:C2H2-type domain-containing protein n=1 Tax=Mortierella alpina TaxID=64518 RepID=A0A9P6JIX4_MORAP|nr:hypothetical protein BGZ70_009017 [Mortierella alpina]